MALSPLRPRSERAEAVPAERQPSRTYSLFGTIIDDTITVTLTLITAQQSREIHAVGDYIDGIDAIKQYVHKALITARYRFPIYDGQYGCELENIIGADVTDAYIEAAVPDIIEDALIYDDRIESVSDFNISRQGDRLYVSFTVTTVEGVLQAEVVA